MSKIVPLISSGTKGPLGVLHLPRLWQKVSLEAAGKIADGYPGIGAGYDSMVIAGLGLDAEAVRSYITNEKPSYTQFEAWIQAQEGAKLDAESIGALNASIEGEEPVYEELYDLVNDSKELNNLADSEEHEAVLMQYRARCRELVVEARGGEDYPKTYRAVYGKK